VGMTTSGITPLLAAYKKFGGVANSSIKYVQTC
jgi:hypothetical protein